MDAKFSLPTLTLIDSIPCGTDVVAVTKTHPFDSVLSAYAAGLRHIGENRVEEARGKIEEAKNRGISDLVWHMIGHVQSRKVRDVVALFDRVDSVDSFELLEIVNKEAEKQQKHIHVLLEVNIANEATKFGFRLNELASLRTNELTKQRSNVIVNGLMTMAPYTKNPEENRWIFKRMKELSMSLQAEIPGFGSALSMGTSCDFKVAIEEGATEVRLGEALFGKRVNNPINK